MKSFLALCLLASAPVFAATQGLTINGTVSSQCAFASVTNGVFGFDVAQPNILDTAATGGTNASVGISYNATPTISIDAITAFDTIPSGFTDSVTFLNYFTSANLGTISYTSGVASGQETNNISDTFTLRVKATDVTGSFPVGNYAASTVITCQ